MQLMNDPVTAVTWQTAFRKDFRSICQRDNKIVAKGTNAMFMMAPEEVDNMPAAKLATYANAIIDYQAHKDNP
jgi:hypothetical protein